MISVKNVSKSFQHLSLSQKTVILQNVDLSIPKGSWISIVGPSGSGKSTLLNIISGLLKPDTGEIYYNDVDLYQLHNKAKSDFRRKTIGFVFQDFKLLPYYSVVDNVMLPLLYDRKKKELYDKAVTLLQSIGIKKELFSRLPEGLSGGEKQRVAIARSLIADPDVMVCDEPTGNLDRENRDRIIDLLGQLREDGKTIILVTHDLDVADHGDKLYFLKDGSLTLGGVSV
ncbi:ABC transporter ATP-binding protein [Aquibacillus sp. 3ASR75-11]|uniref:ABC transporter ATP-binding protein n=1 Tax=Terrihalobacillus insolitus TaxID=2950438 RepID=A0A9X3WU31_9BACI|nr:ABC transporter ATP-binding protein [Terrihalobacillus insolitus]MDC3411981.1 ABC transporter ATP-binding protein [Terrihalobacillus insolitus]MDC3423334.1 ABC transporter ATP-binding protein [Terrihalobacillus insolitus]